MKWTEITLRGVQPLKVGGQQVGTVERRERASRIDGLAVRFDAGAHVDLSAAVDVSERLQYPRIYVIEGAPRDTFLLFGGEKAYWLTSSGVVKSDLPLFRRWGEEEYWTTQAIQERSGLILIYEAGVLAIDETLQVRWHESKLFNDDFVAVEGDALRFLTDGETEWLMRLEDGTRH